MATRSLASWAVALEPSKISSSVRQAAARSLYNYLGCAINGAAHPAVDKAARALSPFFGAPTASRFGTAQRIDAPHAALLNGIASHVHDYDDTHLATIIHPTGPVASAACAAAQWLERRLSGAELVAAITAGIEAECKAGLAVWPTHYDVGWHITSTTGSLGAAVAVGKLLRLDEERMAHAIGLAAVQVTGLREMFGSDTKAFHPGRAAQAGLEAAVMAREGYTSSPQALEAKRGWAAVVVGAGTPQLDKFIGELGSVWETERNAFKPFPCGIVKHPVIDGCIQIHERLNGQGGSPAERLAPLRVALKVHPLVMELTSKPSPRDGLEAKFSVFHGAAVGLLFGKAGPAQYADQVVTDPAVIKVRNTTAAEVDPSLRSDEAVITLFREGQEIDSVHVEHAIGSLHKPMSDADLANKFIDQVETAVGSAEKAKELSGIAWKLADAENVSELLNLL